MTDAPRHDPTEEPAPASYSTPLWAKVFASTMTVVIVLFVILRFTVFAGE